jgi:hypothetical protein
MLRYFRTSTFIGTLAVALALASGTSASAAPNGITTKTDQATKPDGSKGFLFRLTGRVDGAKGETCQIAVFLRDKDNRTYKPRDKAYDNGHGDLCVWAEFTPSNDEYLVTHELFLPYSAMVAQGGAYDVSVQAVIWCPGQNKYLGQSTTPERFVIYIGPQTPEEAKALKAGEKQAKERLDELLRKEQERFDAQLRLFLNDTASTTGFQVQQQPQTNPGQQVKQGQGNQQAQAAEQARRNAEHLRQLKEQQNRNEQQRLQMLEQQRRNEQQRLQLLEQQRRNDMARTQQYLPPRK